MRKLNYGFRSGGNRPAFPLRARSRTRSSECEQVDRERDEAGEQEKRARELDHVLEPKVADVCERGEDEAEEPGGEEAERPRRGGELAAESDDERGGREDVQGEDEIVGAPDSGNLAEEGEVRPDRLVQLGRLVEAEIRAAEKRNKEEPLRSSGARHRAREQAQAPPRDIADPLGAELDRLEPKPLG